MKKKILIEELENSFINSIVSCVRMGREYLTWSMPFTEYGANYDTMAETAKLEEAKEIEERISQCANTLVSKLKDLSSERPENLAIAEKLEKEINEINTKKLWEEKKQALIDIPRNIGEWFANKMLELNNQVDNFIELYSDYRHQEYGKDDKRTVFYDQYLLHIGYTKIVRMAEEVFAMFKNYNVILFERLKHKKK